MGDPAKRITTYADLEAVPPHLVAEMVDGELYTHARPAPPHGYAQTEVIAWTRWLFDDGRGGPGGWWIFTEPEVRFRSDICVPDIAGWRKSNMPELPQTSYFTRVPDWVCEVLSPSTASFDRVKKMRVYTRERVEYVWLLSPLERTLEAYQWSEGRYALVDAYADDERVRVPPFEQVELELERLWVPKQG